MTLRPLKPLLHILRVRSSHCEYADGVDYRRLIALTSFSMAIRGRSRLSKAGDARIRAKLYMAAVVAIQHNPDIKQQYERLLKNVKSKMSALGAAMRKLVQICFGVLKHQTPYQSRVN